MFNGMTITCSMSAFTQDRLDVYRAALEFLAIADEFGPRPSCDAETGRTVLDRIFAMLTAMARKLDQSGADAGGGAGAEQRKMYY
jgi:hypothetical protein